MSEPVQHPEETQSPVVVVSNRLPFTIHRGPRGLERRPSSGGLVSALDPVLRARGGTWIGWPGLDLRGGEEISQASNYRVEAVSLSDAEVQRYYQGFSNGTLWPLFHSLPALARFERLDWQVYERVNHRFASSVSEVARDEDLIWIHDYHLMLVPEQVRQRRPSSRIAFFLHIPFPPYDLFRLCPWEIELLTGLLGEVAQMGDDVMTGLALDLRHPLEIELGSRLAQGRQLFVGDRQPELLLALCQPYPDLPPEGVAVSGREDSAHLRRGVAIVEDVLWGFGRHRGQDRC